MKTEHQQRPQAHRAESDAATTASAVTAEVTTPTLEELMAAHEGRHPMGRVRDWMADFGVLGAVTGLVAAVTHMLFVAGVPLSTSWPVVLATPVGAMAAVVEEAAPALEADALVTDVGSIKRSLAETLPGLLPDGVHYVGSHPMAGGHQRGARFADPDLFEGAPCVVMQGGSAPDPVVEKLAGFWRSLGARVVFRVPSQHDQEVAWVSHVPHALAFAYARALGGAPSSAR